MSANGFVSAVIHSVHLEKDEQHFVHDHHGVVSGDARSVSAFELRFGRLAATEVLKGGKREESMLVQ